MREEDEIRAAVIALAEAQAAGEDVSGELPHGEVAVEAAEASPFGDDMSEDEQRDTAIALVLDAVRAAQEAELAENADFLAKSAIRQIEARNKRQLTAKTFESLRQLTAIVRSWLRDVMAVCAETPELVINVDARASVMEAAEATDEARAAAALAAVRRCDEAISYNVSPETCIDAMLFEIREVLYGSHSAD